MAENEVSEKPQGTTEQGRDTAQNDAASNAKKVASKRVAKKKAVTKRVAKKRAVTKRVATSAAPNPVKTMEAAQTEAESSAAPSGPDVEPQVRDNDSSEFSGSNNGAGIHESARKGGTVVTGGSNQTVAAKENGGFLFKVILAVAVIVAVFLYIRSLAHEPRTAMVGEANPVVAAFQQSKAWIYSLVGAQEHQSSSPTSQQQGTVNVDPTAGQADGPSNVGSTAEKSEESPSPVTKVGKVVIVQQGEALPASDDSRTAATDDLSPTTTGEAAQMVTPAIAEVTREAGGKALSGSLPIIEREVHFPTDKKPTAPVEATAITPVSVGVTIGEIQETKISPAVSADMGSSTAEVVAEKTTSGALVQAQPSQENVGTMTFGDSTAHKRDDATLAGDSPEPPAAEIAGAAGGVTAPLVVNERTTTSEATVAATTQAEIDTQAESNTSSHAAHPGSEERLAAGASGEAASQAATAATQASRSRRLSFRELFGYERPNARTRKEERRTQRELMPERSVRIGPYAAPRFYAPWRQPGWGGGGYPDQYAPYRGYPGYPFNPYIQERPYLQRGQ
ncbi:MAG: hypothetical protein KDI83_15275 [Gammaproteobacteria bacterium]|nr:hypothetical protein [Gammaproteobacteria bacterium]